MTYLKYIGKRYIPGIRPVDLTKKQMMDAAKYLNQDDVKEHGVEKAFLLTGLWELSKPPKTRKTKTGVKSNG